MSYHRVIQDALVIGGGPAGLAAATSLGRACRHVMVFDSHEYRNAATNQIHNVLIHDGQEPVRFRNLGRHEIHNTLDTVTFVETTVTDAMAIEANDGSQLFELHDENGVRYRGKKLILATGSVDLLPNIAGFHELWGNGIVHCFFCDAYEKREKTAGVLGLHSLDDIAPALMAVFLSQDRIIIYTNGDDPERYRFQDHLEMAIARGCRLDTRRIVSVTRSSTENLMIRFECGPADYVNFLMYTPPTRNRAQNLISQLGIETAGPRGYAMPKGADGETNVRGCFVAGDTSSLNKTIAAALNSGHIAGAGAARQLALDEGWEALHA